MTETANPPPDPWPARLGWLAGLVVLLFLPLFLDRYHTLIVTGALIFAVAAVALQLLLGVAGLLSLGQAAFLGIGAYTSALLTTALKLPFELGFLLAGVVSGISSLLLAPITRLRGTYLGVATLAFTIIVHLVILNEEWLTGGSFGMMKIPKHGLGSWSFRGELPSYYLCLAVLVVVCAAFHRLIPSRFGRALQAIMLNEEAARASGINVTLYKSQAFVVAAVVTGFAGALFAHHAQYLNPNDFTFWKSVEILLMVAVGGIGSTAGAVIGAFVVVLLPELLRFADEYRMVIFAALLILLMGVGQDGLAGLVRSLGRRLGAALRAVRAPSLQRGAAE